MKKNEYKIALILLFIVLMAIAVIVGSLFNKLNEIVVLIIVSICLTSIFAIFHIWEKESYKLEERKIIELKSKLKVNNPVTRNILKIFFFMLLIFNFYIFLYSKLNNFYAFLFFGVFFILNIIFLTPKKLIINNNAIHFFLNWKVNWAELKAYQLNKNIGILIIDKVDGQTKQVKGINEKDFNTIEYMIKKNGCK